MSKLSGHESPRFQTFRTHADHVPSENLKEAASFFSTSGSVPQLHTASPSFDFSNFKSALPAASQQVPVSFPEMLHRPAQSNSSGTAWASDFMNFQQTQPSSSSKQVMTVPPSISAQNVQQQHLQNSGS